MAETGLGNVIDLRDLDIDICLSIYADLKMDWLPVQTIREHYNDTCETDLPLPHFTRVMRELGEQPVQREYDGRRLQGFYRRQFVNIQAAEKAALHDIAIEEHGHDLEDCAGFILEWLATADPDWQMLIEAVQQMRGFDNKTTLASLAGYALSNRLHMDVPPLDIFNGPVWTPEPQECSICGDTYQMAYPGQPPCCLKADCGREYHRRLNEEGA